LVVHASLGKAEWPGAQELAAKQAADAGLPFIVAKASKSLFDMVKHRFQSRPEVPSWPSAAHRQCTSDLKRGPIQREVRRYAKANGFTTIINALGLRAQESHSRAKRPTFKKMGISNSVAAWYEWLPIHDVKTHEVFERIKDAGQEPHYAYALGNERLSCVFCLSGDTEVVTRNGIRRIGDLAGTMPELLIPKRTGFGISTHGTFKRVPVENLGRQPLLRIKLRNCRQLKTIDVTPEHRWFVTKPGRRTGDKTTVERTTLELEPGDKLKSLMAQPVNGIKVPFAVAQGFVFGDGCKGYGERPAILDIYSQEKDGDMLPYFSAHNIKNLGDGHLRIYGLPRLWKQVPSMNESRSFLLSWLAGYFAADGCVSKIGAARIDSSNKKHIEFARNIAVICGIGHGAIRTTMRKGTGDYETALYSINLAPVDLPDWFFINSRHRERVIASRLGHRPERTAWKVESVEDTGRIDDVFCAFVPDVHAFGLLDGIMTGNCIMGSRNDLRNGAQQHPALLEEYDELEKATGYTMHASRIPLVQLVEEEEDHPKQLALIA
jgi:hypothetical protein